MKIIIIIILFSITLHAEKTPAWNENQDTADKISWGLVIGQITINTIHNIRSDNPKRDLINQSFQTGITILAAESVKRLVHRTRPNGYDNKSFYSMHSSLAFANGCSVNIQLSIPIGTGYFRMASNWHYPTDVLVGAATGCLASRIRILK